MPFPVTILDIKCVERISLFVVTVQADVFGAFTLAWWNKAPYQREDQEVPVGRSALGSEEVAGMLGKKGERL